MGALDCLENGNEDNEKAIARARKTYKPGRSRVFAGAKGGAAAPARGQDKAATPRGGPSKEDKKSGKKEKLPPRPAGLPEKEDEAKTKGTAAKARKKSAFKGDGKIKESRYSGALDVDSDDERAAKPKRKGPGSKKAQTASNTKANEGM